MNTIALIGLDIAKSVFQVHAADAGGRAIVRRKLKRDEVEAFFRATPPCIVGLEACPGSHHWERLIRSRTSPLCPAAATATEIVSL